jgi:putative pyruvate formate lyase activating enzyme
VAKQSIKAMFDQVGDLCFTSDGIARKGVLVRHLVMPGQEGEGKQIVQWLAENVSKDLCIHIMEQYYPSAHVGKPKKPTKGCDSTEEAHSARYNEINRPINDEEVSSVRGAAQNAGLWRLVEVSEHGGFNI